MPVAVKRVAVCACRWRAAEGASVAPRWEVMRVCVRQVSAHANVNAEEVARRRKKEQTRAR